MVCANCGVTQGPFIAILPNVRVCGFRRKAHASPEDQKKLVLECLGRRAKRFSDKEKAVEQ